MAPRGTVLRTEGVGSRVLPEVTQGSERWSCSPSPPQEGAGVSLRVRAPWCALQLWPWPREHAVNWRGWWRCRVGGPDEADCLWLPLGHAGQPLQWLAGSSPALGLCAGSWHLLALPHLGPGPPGLLDKDRLASLRPRGFQPSCRVPQQSPHSLSKAPVSPGSPRPLCVALGRESSALAACQRHLRTGTPTGQRGGPSAQRPPRTCQLQATEPTLGPHWSLLGSHRLSPTQLLRAMVSTTCSSLLRSRCRRACSSFSRAVKISSLYLVM